VCSGLGLDLLLFSCGGGAGVGPVFSPVALPQRGKTNGDPIEEVQA
jgi:hypothetical protein